MDIKQKVHHLEARVAALEAWVQIPATQIPGYAAPESAETAPETAEPVETAYEIPKAG